MQKIVNEKADTPPAQRNFLNIMRGMFEWTVSEGRVPENPTLGLKREKLKSAGYHTATEAEIARMEATHAIGTRERLAFDLLLYTGVRRSDVIGLGRPTSRATSSSSISTRPRASTKLISASRCIRS